MCLGDSPPFRKPLSKSRTDAAATAAAAGGSGMVLCPKLIRDQRLPRPVQTGRLSGAEDRS